MSATSTRYVETFVSLIGETSYHNFSKEMRERTQFIVTSFFIALIFPLGLTLFTYVKAQSCHHQAFLHDRHLFLPACEVTDAPVKILLSPVLMYPVNVTKELALRYNPKSAVNLSPAQSWPRTLRPVLVV